MTSRRFVKLDDDKTLSLLAELLPPGEQPTGPRVRALLHELRDRRRPTKEPAMPTLEDLEAAAAADATGAPLPPAPPAIEDKPVLGENRTDDPIEDIPEAAQGELIDAAKASYTAFDEARRRKVLQRPVAAMRRASRIENLTEAARVLIAELDPRQQEAIDQVATENGWPPWVVVLGAVARSADLQELIAGDMRPEWLNQSDHVEKAAAEVAKCVRCGGVIPNPRRGQVACCSRHGSGQDEHSDGCALAHLKAVGDGWFTDTRR
jgi:hypothetical protein